METVACGGVVDAVGSRLGTPALGAGPCLLRPAALRPGVGASVCAGAVLGAAAAALLTLFHL